MASKSPVLLTPQERERLTGVPSNLTEREIARYYTLSPQDLQAALHHRRPQNRLGFAVQLCMLRFPGRALTDLPDVPAPILVYIAEQVHVPPQAFLDYGRRENTLYEHLQELRDLFGFRNCGWRELLRLTRILLPHALESDQALPLFDIALEHLRVQKVIAPGITTLERLVWTVQRIAQRRIEKRLTRSLSAENEQRLDSLLETEVAEETEPTKPRGFTRLSWLRQPPQKPSARSLKKILARITFVQELKLPSVPATVHNNRRRQLACRCARYPAQALAKFPQQPRYALLVAYLDDLSQELTDQALDMFGKMMAELLRKGEHQQEQHFQTNARTVNGHLLLMANALEAFLKAHKQTLDPYETVFAVADENTLAGTVQKAKAIARPADLDYLDLIEGRYSHMRSALLVLYQTLSFQSVQGQEAALLALNHIQFLATRNKRVETMKQKIGNVCYEAPVNHLSDRWRKHALKEDKINPDYYEAAAWELLLARLRSGDIYVRQSRRYRNFESYLLPREEWNRLKQTQQTRLVLPEDAQTYLTQCHQQMQEKLDWLKRELPNLANLSLDTKGELHLEKLDKVTPEAVKPLRRRLYSMLPRIPLADLLIEVDGWTGFLRHLTHLGDGTETTGENRMTLLATLMAMGMNIGLTKMAESAPFTYRQMAWVADWFLREETLSKAQAELDNFVLRQPISKLWGDGTRSSSDGMRVRVGVQAAHADRNAEYFPKGRGVTIYSHIADIGMPYAQKVISTNEREALHVIDALCHHETDFDIQEHYTDTAGYTDHVFSICAFLGFRFAPRLADLLDHTLYRVEPLEVSGSLSNLITGRVSKRAIVENWDGIRRAVASIRQGTVSASLLMRKLASYPRQNRLAQGLCEMGKIEKTLFILTYLPDEAMQRRVQLGLNKGEAVHSLARALFFAQRGEFRERDFQEQTHRASCLHLLIAAIAAWNTVYLTRAVNALREAGEEVPDELLAHVLPLGWEHIILLGRYEFNPTEARPLSQLRPLRAPSAPTSQDENEDGHGKRRPRRRA
jgi:TnpA family transposase